MGFLKTIFIIVAIYYAFRLLFRYLLPLILRMYVKKKFGNNFNGQKARRKKEGEVHVNYRPERNKKIKTDVGDYTDFEEIK